MTKFLFLDWGSLDSENSAVEFVRSSVFRNLRFVSSYHAWLIYFYDYSASISSLCLFLPSQLFLSSMDITTDDKQLRRRRPSTSYAGLSPTCRPLPYSLEALDLSPNSPTQAMASLRFLVLSYLAELETRLSQLESPDFEAWKVKGEVAMEDANQWVSSTLELLDSIRADVSFHLPDIHALSVDSLTSHFPDVPSIRSHLPGMSDMHVHLPDFSLSDMRAKLEDIRARFHDIDFDRPINYLPTLLEHLHDLTLPPFHQKSYRLASISAWRRLAHVLQTFSTPYCLRISSPRFPT